VEEFWENSLPPGYYDMVLDEGMSKNRGLQANWHNTTYLKISDSIDECSVHLDYACGPGSLIGNYLNSDKLYGVDISKNQIQYAKNKYGKKGYFFINENFKEEEYKNYFDSISTIGLMEYLSDEEIKDLLNDFYLMLKPEGKLLITTPNYGGLMSIIDKLLNNFGQVNYEDENINKLNKKRLIKILKNSQFNKVNVHSFNNLGIGFSIFNIKLGIKISSLISKLSFNKIGFLLFARLDK
tara:strand:- start:5379 stop:6095 length:717 start_codon:yes stop_codon:yes gene_type:complete